MAEKKLRQPTAKEEAFAQEVVKNGGAKLKAYQVAGYSQKMDVAKQSIAADKIYHKANVTLRRTILQAKADSIANEKFCISVEERLRRLDTLYHKGIEEFTSQAGIKAYHNLSVAKQSIEVMNAMLGVNERGEVKPVKVQIGVVDAS